ncbi:putative copper homeostasis (lipo)protein LpqS [Mycobacterium intracellulare]
MMPRLLTARPMSGRVSRASGSTCARREPTAVVGYLAYPRRCDRGVVPINDASRPPRSQLVVLAAIVLALAMLLGFVAVCGLLRSAHPGPHSPRLTLTSLGNQLTVSVDQPYMDTGSSKACRTAFDDAVLSPSPATVLAGWGVVAAAGAMTARQARRVETFGRDPPRGPATFLAGQGLLTRLCLSRR